MSLWYGEINYHVRNTITITANYGELVHVIPIHILGLRVHAWHQLILQDVDKAIHIIGLRFDIWQRPTWNILFVKQTTTESMDCSESTIELCSIEYNLWIKHVNGEDIVRIIVIILLETKLIDIVISIYIHDFDH